MDEIDENTIIHRFENGVFVKDKLWEQMTAELEELRAFKARVILAVLEVEDD